MADSKITALASIGTGTDPANDPLVIVDVSDVSPGGMSATGTTKKVTLNNLLACSPTATLASATITGDLTVKTNVLKVDTTNNRVGIGTASPAYLFDVLATGAITATSSFAMARITGASAVANDLTLVGPNTSQVRINFGDTDLASVGEVGYDHSTNRMRFVTNNQQQYTIDPNGVFTWYDGAGGTRMTLNSTGLGVGVVPDQKLCVLVADSAQAASFRAASGRLRIRPYINAAYGAAIQSTNVAESALQLLTLEGVSINLNTNVGTAMTLDAAGNVGIGVTPSAWNSSAKAFEIGTAGNSVFSSAATFVEMTNNAYLDSVSNWNRVNTGNAAARFRTSGSGFLWLQAAAGANPITWTTAMQLDASGNLILQSSATPATLTTNGQLTVNATSNTNLRFSYRGSDGTTRTANITLA